MNEREYALIKDTVGRLLGSVIPVLVAIFLVYYFMVVAQREDAPGSLRIRSTPPGIPILIDGSLTMYRTDTLISNVKVGIRRIALSTDRWNVDPQVISINVESKKVTEVIFTATPKPQDSIMSAEKSLSQPLAPDTARVQKYVPSGNRSDHSVFPNSNTRPSSIPVSKRLGTIQITSNLAGGDITVNGIATGKQVPTMLEGLQPGQYLVTIAKEGFLSIPSQITVTVDPDVGLSAAYFEMVSKQAEVSTGFIQLNTLPVGQTVIVEGRRFGPTPITIEFKAGSYLAEFAPLSGYTTPKGIPFTIRRGETATISATFEKVGGNAAFALVAAKGTEALEVGKIRIEVNGHSFFNGSNSENSVLLWNHFPEGDNHIAIIYDNLSAEIDASFSAGNVTPIEIRFERIFAQVKPRLRLLEQTNVADFRKRYGKVLVFD